MAKPIFVEPSEKPLPPRMMLVGVEGFGKTTLGAFAPDSVIIMTRGEDGYNTLYSAGLVPKRQVAYVKTWSDLKAAVSAVPDSAKWVVIDTINGAENLCATDAVGKRFNSSWDKALMYAKVYRYHVNPEFALLIQRLDELHQRGVGVIFLVHSTTNIFNNPEGDDYTRFSAALYKQTWDVVCRFCDVVLFGNFYVATTEDGKAVSSGQRVIYTGKRAAYDAKNRYDLPHKIELPNDRTKMFSTVISEIRAGMARNKKGE